MSLRILALSIISIILVAGCIQTGDITDNEIPEISNKELIETINVMGCDFGDSINVFSTYKRGEEGIRAGVRQVGVIPACRNVTVEVLERICSNDIEYDLIRYDSVVGWVTRRALTCPDGVGCYIAPDTICEY